MTKKEIEKMSVYMLAVDCIKDRMAKLTNYYSPLYQKCQEAVNTLMAIEYGGLSSREIRKILDKKYIAYKLWERNDIADSLIEKGFPATDKNIDLVLKNMWVDGLHEANDYDWEIIEQGISNVEGFLDTEEEGQK